MKRFAGAGRLEAKYPKGTLVLPRKIRGDLETSLEIKEFLDRFGFEMGMVLHGVAVEKNGRAVIISGPQGTEKSTVMRKLVNSRIAKPVDDGEVIIGKKGSRFFVMETGRYPLKRHQSIVSKITRVLTGYKSPYTKHRPKNFEMLRKQGERKHRNATITASMTAKDRSGENAEQRLVELGNVFLLTHPKETLKPKVFSRKGKKSIRANRLPKHLNSTVGVEFLPSHKKGLKKTLLDKISGM